MWEYCIYSMKKNYLDSSVNKIQNILNFLNIIFGFTSGNVSESDTKNKK